MREVSSVRKEKIKGFKKLSFYVFAFFVPLFLFLLSWLLISTLASGSPGTWKTTRASDDSPLYGSVSAVSSGRYDSSGNSFDWATHCGSRGWNSLCYSSYLYVEFHSDTYYFAKKFNDETTGSYSASYPGSITYVYTYAEADIIPIVPPGLSPFVLKASTTCRP
ncbi:MAG: hypothetical protein ACP5KW_10540 [Thermoproteota archaeon]